MLSLGGFNAFFGDENNKDEIMMILNELLPEHRQVAHIDFMPNENPGPVIGYSKDFRYDFICHDAFGAVFIVELQKYYEKSWFKRCVSYASRAYDRQNRSGEDESHEMMTDVLRFVFLELGRFNKRIDELESVSDKWIYLLKYMHTMTEIPPEFSDPMFTRLFLLSEINKFTADEYKQYTKSLENMGDYTNIINTAAEEAEIRGRAIGREEGRTEGRAEGEAAARLEDARRFKELGVAVDIISQATGLSVETIESL